MYSLNVNEHTHLYFSKVEIYSIEIVLHIRIFGVFLLLKQPLSQYKTIHLVVKEFSDKSC